LSLSTNLRVLVVDDQPAIHEDFKKALVGRSAESDAVRSAKAAFFGSPAATPQAAPFELESAFQGQEALAKVRAARESGAPFAMAFVDVRMPPGWDGIETIARLFEADPELQCVICTAYSDYSWDAMIAKLGRTDRLLILKKPFDPVEVRQLASALTEKWNASRSAAERLDEVRRAEQEARAHAAALEKARAAAEVAARAKSEILGNVSHEIRTPMIAILGSADLIGEEGAGEAARTRHLETIRTHGRNLLSILDDILAVAQFDTGRLAIERSPCSPLELVEEVLRRMRPIAEAKGLRLASECLGPVPERFESDPSRVRQVLTNLVGNAIKFTESGSVRATLALATDESGTKRLEISVVDTGIGIPAEAQPGLFDAFHQVDGSLTRRHGGTGLGLAVSRRLAQALGGDVAFESRTGAGSRFTLSLPLSDTGVPLVEHPRGPIPSPPGTGARTEPRSELAPLAGSRILLVEDAPVTRALHARILRAAGSEVVTAENGAIGADLAVAAWREGRSFALVLMDIQMPVMDGYESTRKIRAAGCDVPIVAVTAHFLEGDREKALAAGCDDHAGKPIERDSLIELCRRSIAGARQGS
jgi:two-component system, sensor histidine kinase and response regulator